VSYDTESGKSHIIPLTISISNKRHQLYMGVAADCVYVSRQGSKENATTQILTNWNSASSLYKVCRKLVMSIRIPINVYLRTRSTSVLALQKFKFAIQCKGIFLPQAGTFQINANQLAVALLLLIRRSLGTFRAAVHNWMPVFPFSPSGVVPKVLMEMVCGI
jgi:hypothetical protein